MVRVYAELRAQGERFRPSEAERAAGVTFSTKSEPGEIGTIGRYAGKPKPYGSAELLMSVEAEAAAATHGHLLDGDWLKQVALMVPHCRSAGATSVVVHLDVSHDGQCNLAFSPEELTALAGVGVPLTLSTFAGLE
jgi:hypothetical protein